MGFTIIVETEIVTKEVRKLSFYEARQHIKWIPSNPLYNGQLICKMSDEYIKNVINTLIKFGPDALCRKYNGIFNGDWLSLFKKELKYRKSIRKVQDLNIELTAAITASNKIRNS